MKVDIDPTGIFHNNPGRTMMDGKGSAKCPVCTVEILHASQIVDTSAPGQGDAAYARHSATTHRKRVNMFTSGQCAMAPQISNTRTDLARGYIHNCIGWRAVRLGLCLIIKRQRPHEETQANSPG